MENAWVLDLKAHEFEILFCLVAYWLFNSFVSWKQNCFIFKGEMKSPPCLIVRTDVHVNELGTLMGSL